MAKIFITGATGQVGSQVARYIITEKKLNVTRPEDVICLVRNPDKATKLKELGEFKKFLGALITNEGSGSLDYYNIFMNVGIKEGRQ